MTNELSTQQKVVITRNGATFYINLDRAERLQRMLLDPNKPDYIELNDTLIAIREITMVAPASKVEEMNRRKKGEWQCSRGHWHSREESVCKQGWGMDTSATPAKLEEKELTDEEKARGARIKELLDSGMSLKKAILTVKQERQDQP